MPSWPLLTATALLLRQRVQAEGWEWQYVVPASDQDQQLTIHGLEPGAVMLAGERLDGGVVAAGEETNG